MTTPPIDGRRSPWRSRWAMPAFCLFLAVLIFGAFALGGRAADGIAPALILVAVGAVFAFGGRSETLRGIGGQDRDERWDMIDRRATWFAGVVLVVVLIGAWLVELARGHDGSPYDQLCAIGGAAYLAGVLYGRFRN